MALLLDTHAFLWFAQGSDRLSARAQDVIQGEPDLLLSLASIWEMAIKHSYGRLQLKYASFEESIVHYRVVHHIKVLPMTFSHTAVVSTLPQLHRDPFDRMLVSQAIFEDVPIVTNDPHIARYACRTIW